ncbi:hypothetical protein JCM9492_13000 [Aquifex pyrophilus]
MFYVSKITPFLFALGILNLFLSLIFKISGDIQGFAVLSVFGFIGLVLLGAMYQIIPNSQNRKLPREWVSYIVLLIVLYAFLNIYGGDLREGGFFLFLSSLIFLFHVIPVLKNTAPLTVRFLIASVLYLSLSFLLLWLYALGYVPLQLAVHTLTVGSMLNAVYGVELAWIPMLLMTTINIRKAEKIFIAKQGSTILFLLTFWSLNYKLIALVSLLELGIALAFIYLLYDMMKRRTMATPLPPVVKLFFVALGMLPLGMIVGILGASYPDMLSRLIFIHADLMVYGFGAFTIFGGMMHLLPRIVWNWKTQKGEAQNLSINEILGDKDINEFIEMALILYALFLATDVLFKPVSVLSSVLYFLILGLFLKNLIKAYLLIFR